MNMPNWDLDGKYTLIKRLGQGSYGSVFSAKCNSTGEMFAIKEIKGLFDDFLDARRILREISVMIWLTHPCIIKIKEVIVKNFDINSLFIIMEYAETDLKKLIKSPSFLDHEQVKHLFYQALVGVKYMHSAKILHRDLKPANILINSDCSLKICDFGLSRSVQDFSSSIILEEKSKEEEPIEKKNAKVSMRKVFVDESTRKNERHMTGHVATRWYRAPELILLEKNYDQQIDVWSLGCIFAELLTMIRDNAPYYIERGPIFPGKSCFPLSPDIENSSFRRGYPTCEEDQLSVIMEIIGTPDEEDLQSIDSTAINYIKSFNIKEKKNLRVIFPGSNLEEIDVLSKMLVFNRNKRITIDQLLDHSYFHNVRDHELEISARIPADFEFDRTETMEINELKNIFMRQITNIN